MKSQMKTALKLFAQFFKIGCFTFGGGWSIVAQMQKQYVEKEKLLTSGELLDITSVGRSLPGTMIGNVGYIFGYHICGVPGAVACLLGIVLPPMLILIAVTFGYDIIKDNIWVAKAMTGVRAAVVPIIAGSVIKLRKGAFPHFTCYLVFAISVCLNLFLKISCIYIIIIAAVLGACISRFLIKKEETENDPS